MSDYNPIELVNDAVAFADGRFGEHYIKRLEAAKARALSQTMNNDLTDTQRAHYGTYAAAKEEELDFFRTAQKTKDDPNLLKRLHDGVAKRLKRQGASAEQQ